jgi:SOS-response transcriptional repressor LexA
VKPSKLPPTDRQLDVLAFIQCYMRAEGAPPSYREIAKALDITSTNGVRDHLIALRRKGLVRFTSRHVIPSVAANCCPTCGRRMKAA